MKKARVNIDQIESEVNGDRRAILDEVVQYLKQTIEKRGRAQLVFICTHNSRRSQFAQVWAAFFADHYQLPVNALSGGTEVTAVHKNTVDSLQRSGFKVEPQKEEPSNPKCSVAWTDKQAPVALYSKLYNDDAHPQSHFAAVMTCSDAEENCPFIPGAEKRIALNYDDPKSSDGKPTQAADYDACSSLIAQEMKYIFSKLKNHG